MRKIVILKTGSTFPSAKQRFGDFEDWIVDLCEMSTAAFSVINVIDDEPLPAVGSLSGVIITGSDAMVTDQSDWMLRLASWLPQVLESGVPLLGICFGHQLLARAMGGKVDYHPKGEEIGSVAIRLTREGEQDKLLNYLPGTFVAHVTHAQTVIQLPANAHLLAENAFEPHHAFRLGEHAWGVQFHPEFSAAVMKAYVDEQSAELLSEGHDVTALQSAIANTAAANALLKQFIALVLEAEAQSLT